MISLDALNDMGRADFVAAIAPVFEEAEWVAEAAAGLRPFPTVAALHQALFDEVMEASALQQAAFLRIHPVLAGLDRLDEAALARFSSMNAAYRARFGFPFIICLRRHSRGSVLRHFARRLAAEPAAEQAAALEEIFRITRLGVAALVSGPGTPAIAGLLSTHVLDTAQGRPGAGIKVELFCIEEGGPERVRTAITDGDGRIQGGLMGGDGPLRIGVYELRFHVGPYFGTLAGPEPAFLDVVPLRVGIAEAEAHYHVPLLVSPWAYSTYRGS